MRLGTKAEEELEAQNQTASLGESYLFQDNSVAIDELALSPSFPGDTPEQLLAFKIRGSSMLFVKLV